MRCAARRSDALQALTLRALFPRLRTPQDELLGLAAEGEWAAQAAEIDSNVLFNVSEDRHVRGSAGRTRLGEGGCGRRRRRASLSPRPKLAHTHQNNNNHRARRRTTRAP